MRKYQPRTVDRAALREVEERHVLFFVPAATSPEQAEQVYEGIADNVGCSRTGNRWRALHYKHDGDEYLAEVGFPHALNGELVLAIMSDERLCYVCTGNRGVITGGPIYVGHHDVLRRYSFAHPRVG